MVALKSMAVWPQLRSPRFALLLLTLAFCLVRARDQPSVDIGIGSTTASVVPADALLAALALVCVATIARRGLRRELWLALGAAAVFSVVLLGTAAANGATAFVSGVKLAELALLGLGAALLIRDRAQFEAVVDVLLAFTLVADAVAGVHFLTSGSRQPAFLGEHDFSALATLPLLYGLALVLSDERRGRAAVAIAAGALGLVLGAALASLVGLYLGTFALILVARSRRGLILRRLAIVIGVVVAVTAATFAIRIVGLGFVQAWFGKPASRPGQYASSWSQRLIYAYIGGRIVVAHPTLGTGWYGNLPPKEYVEYLPAAHRRFSDQPANYFPRRNGTFVPQQAWDQLLYELGIVGATAMLITLIGLGRATVRAARRAIGAAAAVPAAWLAASIGALAGEGLFGGTPLAASFWLVAGVVLALSSVAFVE